METRWHTKKNNEDSLLPLPLVRFLVPPLRLLSAAMWQVAQQRHVKHYGMLEEFVSLVTETIPELLSYRQRAQLILGLRARLILELCRGEDPADIKTLQPHLDRIRAPTLDAMHSEENDEEVEVSEANFMELVQTLLKDPAEREHFFQNIFPVEYGSRYDKALQRLMLDFLSRLEQLLPVPDLTQMVSWLSAAPSLLEECLQSVAIPEQMKTLLAHHRNLGHLGMNDTLPSSLDDCILSSLSLPPLVRVVIATEQTNSCDQSESGLDFGILNKEEILEFPIEHSNQDKKVKKEEAKEQDRNKLSGETHHKWPKDSGGIACSKQEGERAPCLVTSGLSGPPLSPSPPLLDLSLPRLGACNRNHGSSSQWNWDESSTTSEELNQSWRGQTWKRKISDSLEVPLKRPMDASEMRSCVDITSDCPIIYPWGGYTDLQEVLYHTTTDVSKIPWSDQETFNLIDIWGKDCVQRSLKDCVRNRHIFNLISKKMSERGYLRTAEQCHTRIKRLKMSFRQCYENNVSATERLECKFYDQLERILGNEGPSSVPEVIYDVQEVTVGDPPQRELGDGESEEWEFLGHSGLEGTKSIPWMDLETRTLINIWGEDRMQRELRGNHRNGHIFAMISKKMADYGYIRTAEQCQSRVKRLKLSFRQCYENNNTTGRERVECKFYDQLERVLLNELPSFVTLPEDSLDMDVESRDEGPTDSEFPVYSYQEIEAAINSTDERKKVPWSDSETLILLELWGDEKVQQNLRRCPHNGHIYSEISEKLNGHGYSRTSEQCHTRIKRLKLSYRQCRDSKSSPEAERVEFKFYDLLEEILKRNPPSKRKPPSVVADTESINDSNSEKDSRGATSNTTPDKTTSGSWSDPETLALIDIWAEDEVQKGLKGVVHNGHVFADISEKMHDLGYSKTPEQCRWKVKTLRQNFRQCYERKKCGRDKVGYKFYDQLEQVLGYEALSIDVFDEKDDQETGADGIKFTPWSEPETLALIDIWGKEEVQQSLKGCIRNGHIFAEISEKMASMGFPKTAEQCHKRVTKLRKTYRRCRNSRIHGGKPMLFRYYRFLEPVLGNDRSSRDTDVADSCGDVSTEATADSDQETPSHRVARKAAAESSRKMPWSDRETQALLEIWGEDRVQYNLKGCLKNKHIFKHISKRMTAQGFIRTAEQCQTRVKRLKARFYHDRQECKFYEQLEQIFLKEITTDSLPEDSFDMTGELESITDSEPESPPPTCRQATDGPKLPWTDSETQVLIDIWGNDQVQDNLRACAKNKHIFAQISQAMADQGYTRTAEQCQSRVKRLKASFRLCCESNKSGGERVECKFYDQLARIFGNEHPTTESITDESRATTVEEMDVGESTASADQGEGADSPAIASHKFPWSDCETKALLNVWQKEEVQKDLKGCIKNRQFFSVISQKMADQGYIRTAEQCQSRVKRLKKSFRECQETNKFSSSS